MKDFTLIQNSLLRPSQLTINARYLLCVLLRYCGNKEYCFPSQVTLGEDLGLSPRQVSVYLKELIHNGLVSKTRSGFNKPNTYKVAKTFTVESQKIIAIDKKCSSDTDKKPDSTHICGTFPLHTGKELPPNNTYLIVKDNNNFNKVAFEKFKRNLIKKRLIPDRQNILRKNHSKTKAGNLIEVLQKKSKELTFKRNTEESTSKNNNSISESVNSQSDQKDGCIDANSSIVNKPNRFKSHDSLKIDSRRAVHKICSN